MGSVSRKLGPNAATDKHLWARSHERERPVGSKDSVHYSGGKCRSLPVCVVEPGIPEIKRLLLPRKRAPKIRLSFTSYTPRVGTFIERDGACCFPCFVGQVRYLRGHSGPHQERPPATLGL